MKTIYIVSERSNGNFVAEFDSREDAEYDISEWGKEGDDIKPEDLEISTLEVDDDYELIVW
jgi:hypothetical protein